jgi:hypothetical protein
MGLNTDGTVFSMLQGATPREQTLNKIAEMRRELARIQTVLGHLEGQVRVNAPAAAMKPQFSAMFNWYVSAMESFFAMTNAMFGRSMKDQTIDDFNRRFTSYGAYRR